MVSDNTIALFFVLHFTYKTIKVWLEYRGRP